MRIAGRFSFNGGLEVVSRDFPELLKQVHRVIGAVDASLYKTKLSEEVGMEGQLLYAPKEINKAFKREFLRDEWKPVRIPCEYPTTYYEAGYTPKPLNDGAYREMDFVKDRLGVEVQFGKYSFMVYNVCAKMTIFKNLEHIRAGIEIVPVRGLVEEMSSGVSYYEQFVWDLEKRGVSNIDVPVLILGIDA